MLKDYPDVLTPPEVMEILGIGRNLLYQSMQDGTIPAFRMGKKMLLSRKLDAPAPCRLDAPDFGFVC